MVAALSSKNHYFDLPQKNSRPSEQRKYSLNITRKLQGMCLCTYLFATDKLRYAGAFYLPKILKGEVWRLITNPFLHGNKIHLASNMLGLQLSGPAFEKAYGLQGFLKIAALEVAAELGVETVLFKLNKNSPQYLSYGLSGILYSLKGALNSKSLKEKGEGKKQILEKFALFLFGEFITKLFLEKFVGGKINYKSHIIGYTTGMAFGWLNTPNKEAPTNSPSEELPIDHAESQLIEISQVEDTAETTPKLIQTSVFGRVQNAANRFLTVFHPSKKPILEQA